MSLSAPRPKTKALEYAPEEVHLPGAVTREGVPLDLTYMKWNLDKERFAEFADDPTPVWLVRARVGNKVVGWADFYENWGTVENVQVEAKFRLKGVATALYDAVEAHWKTKLTPSGNMERDGREFWKKRDPEAMWRR